MIVRNALLRTDTLFPPALIGTAAIEMLYSVDIVIVSDDLESRAVGVHEYGHFVMCEMMAAESETAFNLAWTDVIIGSANQSADSQASYLAEGFADFIASQVVGGTNYFGVSTAVERGDFAYCDATKPIGMDQNFHQGTLSTAFRSQVGRVATLLTDAFDGAQGPTAPNDGCAWMSLPSGELDFGVGLPPVDAADEPVALPGTAMREVFARWVERTGVLSEPALLGALADVIQAHGYDLATTCSVFELHDENGACPDYVD